MRGTPELLVALLVLLLAAGCGGGDDGAEEPATDLAESITVTSSAFEADQPIPSRYTCDGDNISPPLTWDGVPADARVLALVVDDPDAPGGTYVHWIVLDMNVATASVVEGAVPDSGVQAANSNGDAAYTGPCPPSGTHHYRFIVYALDAPTGLAEGANTDDALAAIDEHAIARGRLTGLYSR
jgi:Raf kinase inhibitor-like YbhB/YbcL family protein